ncbi:MAG: hypothetical protein V2B19_31850 [Pseudomonadota bacterium]
MLPEKRKGEKQDLLNPDLGDGVDAFQQFWLMTPCKAYVTLTLYLFLLTKIKFLPMVESYHPRCENAPDA